MGKCYVVCNFKDGYEFTTEKIGIDSLINEDMKPYLVQMCNTFLSGYGDNREFNYFDNDGNKHPYNYEDLASITINFVEEGE